jgi:hypothetical protein
MILLAEKIISIYRTLKTELEQERYALNKLQGSFCKKTMPSGLLWIKSGAKT